MKSDFLKYSNDLRRNHTNCFAVSKILFTLAITIYASDFGNDKWQSSIDSRVFLGQACGNSFNNFYQPGMVAHACNFQHFGRPRQGDHEVRSSKPA